jgi:hypothetical protein
MARLNDFKKVTDRSEMGSQDIYNEVDGSRKQLKNEARKTTFFKALQN